VFEDIADSLNKVKIPKFTVMNKFKAEPTMVCLPGHSNIHRPPIIIKGHLEVCNLEKFDEILEQICANIRAQGIYCIKLPWQNVEIARIHTTEINMQSDCDLLRKMLQCVITNSSFRLPSTLVLYKNEKPMERDNIGGGFNRIYTFTF
jgi:hypothetical protein